MEQLTRRGFLSLAGLGIVALSGCGKVEEPKVEKTEESSAPTETKKTSEGSEAPFEILKQTWSVRSDGRFLIYLTIKNNHPTKAIANFDVEVNALFKQDKEPAVFAKTVEIPINPGKTAHVQIQNKTKSSNVDSIKEFVCRVPKADSEYAFKPDTMLIEPYDENLFTPDTPDIDLHEDEQVIAYYGSYKISEKAINDKRYKSKVAIASLSLFDAQGNLVWTGDTSNGYSSWESTGESPIKGLSYYATDKLEYSRAEFTMYPYFPAEE